ncbi:MAG: hypothetical protein B6I20_08880 [Bacteroidetes bacterium 4572_117]|nr:MAG: hypothetical protein B6I20_08880 [Bacteroidetes bacterium 4572_117]
MPRPKRKRNVFSLPMVEGFKPFGAAIDQTEAIELLIEEYETIKLADYLNLTQEEAAKKMNISRPTFTRIYDKARKTIAHAFVEGKVIVIKGGDINVDNKYTDPQRNHMRYQMGKGGFCVCLKCEVRFAHVMGEPCRMRKCPECGKQMFRENSYHHLASSQKDE